MTSPELIDYFENAGEGYDWTGTDENSVKQTLKEIARDKASFALNKGDNPDSVRGRLKAALKAIDNGIASDFTSNSKLPGWADTYRANNQISDVSRDEIADLRRSIQSVSHRDKDDALRNLNELQRGFEQSDDLVDKAEEEASEQASVEEKPDIKESFRTLRTSGERMEIRAARKELLKTGEGKKLEALARGGKTRAGRFALGRLFG